MINKNYFRRKIKTGVSRREGTLTKNDNNNGFEMWQDKECLRDLESGDSE
jgi:hypothetical protein